MERCKAIIKDHSRFIEVLSERRQVKVNLRDIMYMETYQRHSSIHTDIDEIKTLTTMDALEKLAGGPPFIRCHKSFLVNMHKIRQIKEKSIILKDGAEIPISRGVMRRIF